LRWCPLEFYNKRMDEDPHRRRVDPRSPVQPDRGTGPYLLAAVVAAIAFWGLQQQWVQDSGPVRSGSERSGPPTTAQERTVQGIAAQDAKGDVRTIFSSDDYPVEAQRNGEEGTVQAELSIDARGRVLGCRVIRSSGHASLDSATCSIVQRRARFKPAQDVNGDAVASSVVTPPVVWRLEG